MWQKVAAYARARAPDRSFHGGSDDAFTAGDKTLRTESARTYRDPCTDTCSMIHSLWDCGSDTVPPLYRYVCYGFPVQYRTVFTVTYLLPVILIYWEHSGWIPTELVHEISATV